MRTSANVAFLTVIQRHNGSTKPHVSRIIGGVLGVVLAKKQDYLGKLIELVWSEEQRRLRLLDGQMLNDPPEYKRLRVHLVGLLSRPKREKNQPHSPDALFQSYLTWLGLIVDEINEILDCSLRVRFGSSRFLRYARNADSTFDIPIGSGTNLLPDGVEEMINADFHPHTAAKKRGVIDVPAGKFMVAGDLPAQPSAFEQAKYLAWLIARCLQSSRFQNLRYCPDCDNFFIPEHGTKTTCCGKDSLAKDRKRQERSRRTQTAPNSQPDTPHAK